MTPPAEQPSGSVRKERLDEAASGARWGVLLFVLGRVLALGTRVLLYRIDKKVFGAYVVIAEILAFSAVQFLVPGGHPPLIKFMPTLHKERRKRYLIAYLILAGALCLAAVAMLQITQAPLEWLLRREIEDALVLTLARYAIFFLPLVVFQTVAVYALMAQGKTAAAAKAQNSIQIIIFCCAVALFAFPGFAVSHAWAAITGCVGLAYAVTLAWAARLILRLYSTPDSAEPAKPLIPKGFGRFASLSHAQFGAQWVGNTLDEVLVCSYMGRAQLAMYGAGLSVARFVRWIPITVGNQLLPLLSQLAARDDLPEMRKLYRRLTLYNVVTAVSIALVAVVFGPQILLVFGKDASAYSPVLSVLSASFCMSAISVVNVNALLAMGRSDLTVGIYVVAAAVEVSLAVAIGGSATAVQLAFMRTAYLLVAFTASTLLVHALYSFRLSSKVAKAALSALCAWAVFGVLGWATDMHQVLRGVISITVYPVLLLRVFRAVDKDDWEFAVEHIMPDRFRGPFKKDDA